MSGFFNNLSIRSRLIIMLIMVTFISSVVIGVLGWRNGRSALNETIFNQLKSIRASQTYQVESYFRYTFAHIRSLANDRMIVNAMTQFQEGYNNGLYQSLSEEQDLAVSEFYDNEFLPEIAKNTTSTPLSVLYQPNRSAARYFQYHYTVNNPLPIDAKDGLVESKDDNTIYNRFHKFYHPIFRNLLKEFGYYDILLVDIKSLSVVYSVFKEVDFATSLQDGPYTESSLGVLANRIKANPERDLVSIMDYRSYAPSYGAPASFVGVPVFDRNEAIGILVIQLPADELNKLMTSDGAWQENGLGETGESYLVGPDKLMRTQSRLHKQNEEEFFKAIDDYGLSETTINNIKTFNTTVLMQPVASSSVQNVFEEQTGTHVTTNYLGRKVLSSYAPLKIPGLDWAIISEITEQEAFKPIATLQRNILIWGVVLVLAVAFLAIMLSRFFVRPIEKLTAGVNALSSGDTMVNIDIQSNDEFGDLASQFNAMTYNIRQQTATIEKKTEENSKLLNNILPTQVIERFRSGEQVADQHQQATVMHLELDGFGEVSHQMGAAKAAIQLQGILDQLDYAADRYDVQPISSAGTAYIVACGLNSARLDHAKRSIDFAVAAIKIVLKYNNDQGTRLSVRIGVDSGPVTSAVIGVRRFKFSLWGDTVDTARLTRNNARPNTLLVTNRVYERVKTHYAFQGSRMIEIGTEEVEAHELETTNLSINATTGRRLT